MKWALRCSALLALICNCSSPIYAQESVPTIEQCRAYKTLWADTNENSLTADVLTSRGITLLQCEVVIFHQHGDRSTYADLAEADAYTQIGSEYMLKLAGRYRHFLFRHNEYKQFGEEDAKGER